MKRCRMCGIEIEKFEGAQMCKSCYQIVHRRGYVVTDSGEETEENKRILAECRTITDAVYLRKIKFKEMIKREKGWDSVPEDNNTCIICGKVEESSKKLIRRVFCRCCHSFLYSQAKTSEVPYNEELIEKVKNRQKRMRGKGNERVCKACGEPFKKGRNGRGLCKPCYNIAKSVNYFNIQDSDKQKEMLKDISAHKRYNENKHPEPCECCGEMHTYSYNKPKLCYKCRGLLRSRNWEYTFENVEKLKKVIQRYNEIYGICRNCGDEQVYAGGLCRECYLTVYGELKMYTKMSDLGKVQACLVANGYNGEKPNKRYPVSEKVVRVLKCIQDRIESGEKFRECVVCGGTSRVNKRGFCRSCLSQTGSIGINPYNSLAMLEYFERSGKLK